MGHNKSIILVEPFSEGHHLMYLVTFAKVLIDMGYKVEVLSSSSVINKFPIKNVRCRVIDYIDLKNLPIWRPYKMLIIIYNMILKMLNLYEVLRLVKNNKSIVFYCCIDSYIDNMLPCYIQNILMPYQWSGLLLNMPFEKSKKYTVFQSKNCLGIGVLTKKENNPLNQYCNKIIDFPDFSVDDTVNKEYNLRNKIIELSRGRKIVSLLGEISIRKGIRCFIEVMKLLPNDQYFFLIAGGFSKSLSVANRLQIEKEIDLFENSYFYPHRIGSESDFNSLIDITTILYANYVNFFQSSNMLSKAAVFQSRIFYRCVD